tara:strand:- start:527 stop:781 length:255 start_codon:yes stop_codon:yes gene_type:complete
MNLNNLYVGTQLTYTTNRLWNDGFKDINQRVKRIIEVTELFDNRFHFKTVNILEASNVPPKTAPCSPTGGIFYKAINRLDLEIS